MTDDEFTQIMREVGYEVDAGNSIDWYYKKNRNFVLLEDKHINACELTIDIMANESDASLYFYTYKFKKIKQMNPDEFKKKLSGITEYANLLYKDINTRIDALSKKMETYAGLLNDEFKKLGR